MSIVRTLRKFGQILSAHQKYRIFELGILMVIGGFLETCSVSLIMPFMDTVMKPEKAMQTWYAKIICSIFGITSPRIFLITIAVMLAVLYIFKNIYLMFEFSVQYKFVYGNMFAMQSRLLGEIIHRPYTYFLSVNSGEIIRIISNDTMSAFNMLVTFLLLFTEFVVSGMLIIAIFVISPQLTACMAGLIGILMVFIYLVVKPVIRKAAIDQQKSGTGINKWMLQSIHGIKELKVMQKESFFQENYDRNGYVFVNSLRWYRTLGAAPRFIIEGVCMGAMFLVVAIKISTGTNLESMIPVLTAVAMAAIRLLPSANRISNALTEVAYGEPMLDKVIENLKMFENFSNRDSDDERLDVMKTYRFEDRIVLNRIFFHYPGSDSMVLSGTSMDIRKGESIGIVGPSGAGKTTLVDIILGLLIPQEGQVLVDGFDIHEDPGGWLSGIGYIPQSIFMLDDTVRANVAFGEKTEDIDDEKVWEALSQAAMDDFVRSIPEGLDTRIGERGVRFSGGQRQRIGIARALYRNPQLLIFDEATSALDNETESVIMESIHGLKGTKTMIIIAHRLTTVEACDHIYRVEGGEIIKER